MALSQRSAAAAAIQAADAAIGSAQDQLDNARALAQRIAAERSEAAQALANAISSATGIVVTRRSWLDRVVSDVGRAATGGISLSDVVHWADDTGHFVDKSVDEAEKVDMEGLQDAYRIQHEVVENHYFQDAVSDAKIAGNVLSIAAPFLAPIPFVGEAVAVAAVAASGFALIGETAEMANGVIPWSASALAQGAANVVLGGLGAGEMEAGREAVAAGADAKDVDEGAELVGKVLPNLSEESASHVVSALGLATTVYKGATAEFALASTGQSVIVDVHDHNYAGIATDVVAGGADLVSVGTDIGSYSTDGTASDDLSNASDISGSVASAASAAHNKASDVVHRLLKEVEQ
jgi:hypothetical protein